jgi:hypothetical protein
MQNPAVLFNKQNIPDAKAPTGIGFEYKSIGKSWKRREIRNKKQGIRNKEQRFEVQVK